MGSDLSSICLEDISISAAAGKYADSTGTTLKRVEIQPFYRHVFTTCRRHGHVILKGSRNRGKIEANISKEKSTRCLRFYCSNLSFGNTRRRHVFMGQTIHPIVFFICPNHAHIFIMCTQKRYLWTRYFYEPQIVLCSDKGSLFPPSVFAGYYFFKLFQIISRCLSFNDPGIHQKLCPCIGLVEKKLDEILGIGSGRKVFLRIFKRFHLHPGSKTSFQMHR